MGKLTRIIGMGKVLNNTELDQLHQRGCLLIPNFLTTNDLVPLRKQLRLIAMAFAKNLEINVPQCEIPNHFVTNLLAP